jgi:ATP-binding cassette subfamily F protein 3
MRIELAKILLQNPTSSYSMSLPTMSILNRYFGWKISLINKAKAVWISHDRAFIDAITNRTIEVTIRIYDYKAATHYLQLRRPKGSPD